MATKKKNKSFFFKIEASGFMCAVLGVPEEERGEWLMELATDLLRADPENTTNCFAKDLIAESLDFRAQKANAGAKGGRAYKPTEQ